LKSLLKQANEEHGMIESNSQVRRSDDAKLSFVFDDILAFERDLYKWSAPPPVGDDEE
jgi:hypothetical protein